MHAITVTEEFLRADRWIVGAGVALIGVLSWVYLMLGAGTGMSAVAMTTWQFPPPVHAASAPGAGDLSYWIIMASMWWVMMIAMMLPSAAPVVLLYARVYRHGQKRGQINSPYVPTASFVAGYLLVWLAFSLVATGMQWLLGQLGLLDAMMMWSTNTALSGGLLAVAGIYQFSAPKSACLKHCRSPVEFVSQRWRKGRIGAATMGIEHGLYCVGCCWLVMALLFVGGIMNLVWIAGLAFLVLLEKLVPHERWVGRMSGSLMIAAAIYLLLG